MSYNIRPGIIYQDFHDPNKYQLRRLAELANKLEERRSDVQTHNLGLSSHDARGSAYEMYVNLDDIDDIIEALRFRATFGAFKTSLNLEPPQPPTTVQETVAAEMLARIRARAEAKAKK